MMRYVSIAILLVLPVAAASPETPLTFTRLWTHGHTTPGQVSEIPAFDAKTDTIWVAGVVGVDVLDGATGRLIEHIDVTGSGLVNSVAIHNGLAAFAVEAAPDRRTNADRSAAGSAPFSAAAPLDRLRISNVDSSPGNLYAAGARSMSIRDAEGTLVFDSGSTLDTEAHKRGVYDDGRSRDKGVEPEGVALMDIAGRTYAFVSLERTTSSAVAVFDVTNPYEARFLDMIVTPGDLAPEGLAAYKFRGDVYLAIANEVQASGATSTHTTLYRVDRTGR